MSLTIFAGHEFGWEHLDKTAYLYCNTSDTIFGPKFESVEKCKAFINWTIEVKYTNVRLLSDSELTILISQFNSLWEQDIEAFRPE